MAKKNNKGFSLIEIVIAIAILTLLLTPIVRQLSQTMQVSRRAKEQQYVNENAVRELEFVQKADVDKLSETYEAQYGIDVDADVTNIVKSCVLYDTSGNVIDTIDYNVTEYKLGTFELGSRKTEYNKTVILDDLSNKVGAFVKNDRSYRVAYELEEEQLAALSGFTATNEGSMVQYDVDGYVTGVVCKLAIDETGEKINDPNDVNLGNMQNLETDKVAIITGLASNYDAQAETAFYSKAMDRLKVIDKESWEQALLHTSDDSVLNQYAYASSIEKCTKLYIDQLTDEAGEDYFIVKVDVYYTNTYSLEVNDVVHPFDDLLAYNVFTQKFYTEKCPDVYFEYQPYTIDKYMGDGGNYVITYDDNDYILIDNYVENAKLYLYKPYRDQINQSINVSEEDYQSGTIYKYYTTSSFSNMVNIRLCNANADVKQLNIYSNLDTTVPENGSRPQFSCTSFAGHFDSVVSDKTDVTSNQRVDFNRGLYPISEDTRMANRMYTITVSLDPVEEGNNAVKLTGAKGEN